MQQVLLKLHGKNCLTETLKSMVITYFWKDQVERGRRRVALHSKRATVCFQDTGSSEANDVNAMDQYSNR